MVISNNYYRVVTMEDMGILEFTDVFNGLKDSALSCKSINSINSFFAVENLYRSATKEIITKLENLKSEFMHLNNRNPIYQINTRIKTPKSIMAKLNKLGFELSVESARANLTDIAGVRVICFYIDDIYQITDLITSQENMKVIRISDYIKNPKPNGYRSFHMIVTVPVYMSGRKEFVNAEIQIRTVAMNFWASLEYELSYKLDHVKNEDVTRELKDCADVISGQDIRMQNLHNIEIHAKRTINHDPGI